jgi:hypothetical protein
MSTLVIKWTIITLNQEFPTFFDKASAIPWHPTHGETPTPTFRSIRKENTQLYNKNKQGELDG